ncbi:MAG: diguanylate cyclase [Rhizobacter sp.]|nr:diguanylate cyclase [Rhizobacter sp.]
MNDAPRSTDDAAEIAARKLARMQWQIEAARALWIRLLQNVVVAEARLGNTQSAQLVEANEQLVLSAMRALIDVDTATLALNDASRSAERDALTQLPNRLLLLDRFAQAIAAAKRNGGRMAILFLDVDHFKQINDSLGHGVGDEVLQRVAQCLSASLREVDTVGRFGGDEFVILLPEVAQASDAILVAEKVISSLATITQVGKHALRLSMCIGISVYPLDGKDAGSLIDCADAAMYRAKRMGPGGIAVHCGPSVSEATAAALPVATKRAPVAAPTLEPAVLELHNAQLQEANTQLVLAALGAQELQLAAETTQRRQSEFMSIVADELRSPIAPNRVAAAMLGHGGIEQPLLKRLQIIVEAQAKHMSRLALDLLDGPRGATGSQKLEHSTVDMVSIINEAVDACLPHMNKRNQLLEMHLPPGPIVVNGDPLRLSKIVRNLLDNASKHSHNGCEIRLEVTIAAAGDAMLLSVSDTGIGITAQTLPHPFKPFVQDDHAIAFNGVGGGIVLAAVGAAVEAHGGSVVASSPGNGLGGQFVVTLPLVKLALDAKTHSTSHSELRP